MDESNIFESKSVINRRGTKPRVTQSDLKAGSMSVFSDFSGRLYFFRVALSTKKRTRLNPVSPNLEPKTIS